MEDGHYLIQDKLNLIEDLINKEDENTILFELKNSDYNFLFALIDNYDLFSELSNSNKLFIFEQLIEEPLSGQLYISKLLENIDDDFIMHVVKNKILYKKLKRKNKLKVIEKLLNNPWLSKEEAKSFVSILEGNNYYKDNLAYYNNEINRIKNIVKEPKQKELILKMLDTGFNIETIKDLFDNKKLFNTLPFLYDL